MNIEGLDYNTKREKLILPEYGREIQNMIDYAVSLPNRAERQRCAEAIIAIMGRMLPQGQNSTDYQQKLWDHLALMSNFKLDIDYPYDVSQAKKIMTRPEPMEYPMNRIPVRHYGHMMFEIFNKLKDMPEGEERDELIRLAANQMKRDLYQWGHGSCDDEKVASDIANFTDGKVQLDLDNFRFSKLEMPESERKRNKRR